MGVPASQIQLPPVWISLWFGISSIIVLWDAAYCFYRPRSLSGGDLSWIWWPYDKMNYGTADYMYGWFAFDLKDGFTNGQAFMNVIESTLNLEYVYLRHFPPRTERHVSPGTAGRPHYHAHAPLVGFAAALMTSAKTILYFLQEYYCDWCYTKQNDFARFYLFWLPTNGAWIVVPTIIAIVLGRHIARSLDREFASQLAYQEHLDAQRALGGGHDGHENGRESHDHTSETNGAEHHTRTSDRLRTRAKKLA